MFPAIEHHFPFWVSIFFAAPTDYIAWWLLHPLRIVDRRGSSSAQVWDNCKATYNIFFKPSAGNLPSWCLRVCEDRRVGISSLSCPAPSPWCRIECHPRTPRRWFVHRAFCWSCRILARPIVPFIRNQPHSYDHVEEIWEDFARQILTFASLGQIIVHQTQQMKLQFIDLFKILWIFYIFCRKFWSTRLRANYISEIYLLV